jgi:hypothetical protein
MKQTTERIVALGTSTASLAGEIALAGAAAEIPDEAHFSRF